MRYLLSTLLVFGCLYSSAQKTANSKYVKYNTMHAIDSQNLKDGGTVYLYEDKSDKAWFIGQLGTDVELASGDLVKWTIRADADIFLKKWLSFHGTFAHAFLDWAHFESNNPNITNKNENETSAPNYLEVGGRVFLRQYKGHVKHKIILESRRVSHNTTLHYYIEPKLPAQKILALRAGYFSNNTVVNTDMNDGELTKGGHGAVKAEDGTILFANYYTTAFFKGVYLGISDIRIINALTKNTFKKGDLFRSRCVRELYADVLFANATFDPIIDRGISHEIKANGAGSFQVSKIGGRIGMMETRSSKKIAFTRHLEGGFRPSVSGHGWYGSFGVGFTLLK